MGNFDFVAQTLPAVHDDCARAESYLVSDPRSACIYARRALEQTVRHVYGILDLRAPYRDDLAARINDAAFKLATGNGINAKLNLIRKVGNTAVHETRPIRPEVSLAALRELFHVMVWAADRHSPHPAATPVGARFDPALAAAAAPLTRDEAVALAARFHAQDQAHATALAEKADQVAAREAEITRLRAEVAAAQQAHDANGRPDGHDHTEAETRDTFIDLLLNEAGWPLDEKRDREYRVTGMPTTTTDTSGPSGATDPAGTGYVDYVLWGTDGRPLAVVEAKRTSISPRAGQHQATLYAGCLETEFGRRPVIFTTNGYEHWLWDDAAGYPPREVQGFYTQGELELMIQRRDTRQPLAGTPTTSGIADRHYQTRAIAAVGDTLNRSQRDALLVMATGAGKTRTVIALVDTLMKAGWVKRALFLADRRALVRQAVGAFKEHLPGVTTVNLLDDPGGDGRIYVGTYPTMLGLINDIRGGSRRFGPGYFDLVVIDEAHRSVYATYGAIFAWFDAILLGLTATPKDQVDHNTYRLFHLEDGVPTDAYSLDEAVADGYLVPPTGVAVGTRFLRHGIRYADLTDEEKDQWDALDWGGHDPPTEVGAGELNRFLFNDDTVDKVLATLMTDGHRVAGGDRLGKTIIFAANQAHAEFIARRFDVGWPEYAGRFAAVITHSTARADTVIGDFATKDKAPHIAISVDMLDTGIDIPEVVNLVFFKTVHSTSKFWQMIGRGTRLCPDLFGPGEHKTDFRVLDFCGNLEYFSQNLPGATGSTAATLTQRLVEARLALVAGLTARSAEPELRASTADTLHRYVAGMTLANVLVRPHRRAVERFGVRDVWDNLTAEDAAEAAALAGLPSAVRDEDEAAKRFDLIVLRRQLAQLDGDTVTADRLHETIAAIAEALLARTTIPMVAAQAELIEAVAGEHWWTDVTLPSLELMRLRLRDLARFVDSARRNPVYTDFRDELGPATAVHLPGITPGTDIERFGAKVTAYLRDHEDHVAVQRLRRNKQLTADDLDALEHLLLAAGGDRGDLDHAAALTGGLGLFIRSLVGLDRAAAVEAFADYLDGSTFTVEQVRFVTLIVDELTAEGVVEPRRLYESPYTDNAPTGPELLFIDTDVERIVTILDDVKAHAVPSGVA